MIEHIATHVSTLDNTTQSVSVTCQADDYMICSMTTDQSLTVTLPTGFVERINQECTADGMRFVVGTKWATGAESTITATTGAGGYSTFTLSIFRGVDPTTPLDITVAGNLTNGANSLPYTATKSVTPVTTNTTIVTLAGWDLVYYLHADTVTTVFSDNLAANLQWTTAANTNNSWSYKVKSAVGYARCDRFPAAISCSATCSTSALNITTGYVMAVVVLREKIDTTISWLTA